MGVGGNTGQGFPYGRVCRNERLFGSGGLCDRSAAVCLGLTNFDEGDKHMRRFCLMAVFGWGLIVTTAAESQAGLGWLFHHGGSQACCYAPPPCCPSPCGPTTCGYAPAPCSTCSPCSSCSPCGSSACGSGACGSGACGSGCATGNCGVTYGPAPTETVYYAPPSLFPMFARPMYSRPVVVTAPRHTVQTTSRAIQPVVAFDAPAQRVEDDRRRVTTSSQWEPVELR